MATWKRLTELNGAHVDVNMDQVAYLRKITTSPTDVVFAAAKADRWLTLQVKESPEEIQMIPTL